MLARAFRGSRSTQEAQVRIRLRAQIRFFRGPISYSGEEEREHLAQMLAAAMNIVDQALEQSIIELIMRPLELPLAS
jgi:hypothetical protein